MSGPLRGGAALALTAAPLALLPLLPPEVSGISAAASALLLALGAALTLRSRALVLPSLLLALSAWPLTLLSSAPGAAPAALALPLLGVGAAAVGAAVGEDARRWLPALLAVVGTVAALHALWQAAFGLDAAAASLTLAGGDDPVVALAVARLREGRAFAAFATPAALGCFLALALPVTLAALAASRGWGRAAFATGAVLQAAGLAATQSATAVGSLAAGGILLLLRRTGSRRIVLGAVGGLTLLLAGILLLRADRLLDPAAAQGSWRLRAGNAAAAVRMIEARPGLGVGPGAFAEVYPSVLRPGGNEVRHAHCLPLELAAELGIPLGLLAAAAFFAVFLGPLGALPRGAPAWRLGLAVGLAAFAVQNLADFTAFFPSLLWSACLLRGVLTSGGAPAPAWAQAAARVVVALAAVAAAGSGLSAEARRQAAPAGDRRLAARAVALAPWDPDARLLHGAALLRAGEPQAALRETERALDRAPVRPSAHAQRAAARAALGDLPGAYADLRRAAALYPARTAYAREAAAARRLLERVYRGRT